ncbi:hypothetical protein ACF08N_36590 [Streptomyces sp. NPDC015127]|uniref:hypothetical protein n=1 Tax=Streptomyces sp. NPDC015127 TaxID=3364939 RepID=UPI0036FC14F8
MTHRIESLQQSLATALPRPWRVRETLYDALGAPTTVETDATAADLEIIAVNGLRVAEVSVSFAHADVDDGHDRLSVLIGARADAGLIARAPQDLAYFTTAVAQAQALLSRPQARGRH